MKVLIFSNAVTFLSYQQPVRKSSLTRFYLRKKLASRFTLAVWGIPKEKVKDKKIAEEYMRELLPSNALINFSASCDGIPIDGNLLENTRFGPLYPNASEFIIVFMFIVDFFVIIIVV